MPLTRIVGGHLFRQERLPGLTASSLLLTTERAVLRLPGADLNRDDRFEADSRNGLTAGAVHDRTDPDHHTAGLLAKLDDLLDAAAAGGDHIPTSRQRILGLTSNPRRRAILPLDALSVKKFSHPSERLTS